MHHSAQLTVVALAALAVLLAPAKAGATTPALGHLYIPNYAGPEPARVSATLPGTWSPPAIETEPDDPLLGQEEQRTDLGGAAACIRSVTFYGMAMAVADRPVYADGGLRMPGRNGWLLPRLSITRHGTSDPVSWYAGRTFALEVAPGMSAPLIQGIAVLRAPTYATRAEQGLVLVRVLIGAQVEKPAPAPGGVGDVPPIPASAGVVNAPPTPAEAGRCFPSARHALPGVLRSVLRSVRITRRG